MKISERVKARMQKWLEVRPASNRGNIVIREPYSFETDVIRNRVWYRGDADELKQLYRASPHCFPETQPQTAQGRRERIRL